jgi:hypothetical protein
VRYNGLRLERIPQEGLPDGHSIYKNLQYRPGKAHQNADSLSRIPNESGTTGEEEDTEETVIFLTFQEFRTEQLQVEYCGTTRKILLKAQDRRTNEQMVSDNEETTKIGVHYIQRQLQAQKTQAHHPYQTMSPI